MALASLALAALLALAWWGLSWPGVLGVLAGGFAVVGLLVAERRRAAGLMRALRQGEDEQRRLRASRDAARRAATEAGRRYSLLASHGAEVYSRHGIDGEILWVSPSCERILGIAPDELIGRNIFDLVEPRFRPRIRRRREERLRDREPFISLYPVLRRDGSRVWLETSHVLDESDPARPELLAVSRDISARRQASAELRRSERLYHAVFDIAATGMALFDPQDNGRCLQPNAALCEMLGYTGEELREVNFRDLAHPADKELTGTMVGEILRGERGEFQVEKRYLRKDGQLVWALVSGALIRDDNGEPRHISAQIQDISARRRAEEALARLSRRQHLILNATAEGILGLDRKGQVTFANRAAVDLLGHQAQDMLGLDVRSLMPPEADPGRWPILQCLDHENVVQMKEVALKRADGSLLAVDYTCAPVIEKGRIRGAVLVFSDVSELQRLSTQQRVILDAAAEGIYELDRFGRVRFCNRATERILGYSAEELYGRDLHALVHHSRADGSAYPLHECPSQRTLRTGDVQHMRGELFWRKDGTSFPAEYVCAPIIQGGEIQGAVVVFSDASRKYPDPPATH